MGSHCNHNSINGFYSSASVGPLNSLCGFFDGLHPSQRIVG
jgi:hypothetical protein